MVSHTHSNNGGGVPSQQEDIRSLVETSILRVEKWVEDQDYKGYEPFDGLSSWARHLTFDNLLAERILQQIIRQCPLNLRPILGVRPKDSTKGRGYMAWGYLILHRTTGKQSYLDKAIRCLEWLHLHKVVRFRHHSWSNHFDFAGRGGMYTKDDPIIVWTALIGHAFIEAYEVTGNKWCLDIGDSACQWILELPRERTNSGNCISYLPHVQSSIHNSNMLGAGLLARTARHNGNKDYFDVARSAMEYSCSRQLPNGSWWYAEAPNHHWTDNFHTGYNLDSLLWFIEGCGDKTYRPNLEKGLAFYKTNFFHENGCPKYYHTRTYPIDIQCAAQAIDTLTACSAFDPTCVDLAKNVANWTIKEMQDPKGYFYYRQYPLLKAKTPMLHWGQATMFKALAMLICKLSSY